MEHKVKAVTLNLLSRDLPSLVKWAKNNPLDLKTTVVALAVFAAMIIIDVTASYLRSARGKVFRRRIFALIRGTKLDSLREANELNKQIEKLLGKFNYIKAGELISKLNKLIHLGFVDEFLEKIHPEFEIVRKNGGTLALLKSTISWVAAEYYTQRALELFKNKEYKKLYPYVRLCLDIDSRYDEGLLAIKDKAMSSFEGDLEAEKEEVFKEFVNSDALFGMYYNLGKTAFDKAKNNKATEEDCNVALYYLELALGQDVVDSEIKKKQEIKKQEITEMIGTIESYLAEKRLKANGRSLITHPVLEHVKDKNI